MRKSTFLWLVLAALSGGILFHTSQQVTDGRARLETLAQNIREEQESIRVLNAEWSYLNQPARLEKLAGQYLTLQPLTGKQIVNIGDLPARPPIPAPTAVASAAPPTHETIAQPESFKPAPANETAVQAVLHPPRQKPQTAHKQPMHKDVAVPAADKDRSFRDVMKSLGLRHQGGD